MSWVSDATSYDYQFRFVIVGDSTVGKSSLLKYFVCGKVAEECEPTIGVDFYVRTIDIGQDLTVKLQLWDTAGQERFRSIFFILLCVALCVFVYLADILSAFCIPMGCEGTLIDLPFI